MKQRDIFRFWLPLFSSWLLMTAEGPIISAAINRLPEEVVMLAAMGVVFSLAVAIESPIINLLATSTALVRDRQSFVVVRRFTVHWMILLSAVAVLIAFTPLFDLVVRDWLGTPAEVARWILPGMQIMVPWSAAIAWRRFLQGVLISFGDTRKVAWGTAIRLLTSGGMAIGLAIRGSWPGIHIGAVALVTGVVAEAIYATVVARPLVRRQLAAPSERSAEPLTYGRLFHFHLPLASTSVLTLLMQPMVAACLARLDQPVVTLAAWPLVFQFMLLMRAVALALPEAVIALSERSGSAEALRRFSRNLAVTSFGVMAVFASTPLAHLYLDRVQSASPEVTSIARIGLLLFIPLPPLATAVAYLRGVSIHRHRTHAVNQAMFVRLLVTAAALTLGLMLKWPGISTAAGALVLSLAAEWLFLAWRADTHPDAPGAR